MGAGWGGERTGIGGSYKERKKSEWYISTRSRQATHLGHSLHGTSH